MIYLLLFISFYLNDIAYQRVFCFPIIRYYEAAGFDFTKRSFEQLAKDYMDYYQPHSHQCSLFAAAISTLAHYQRLGYHQILLSASKRAFLMEQMEHFPILSYFEAILALDDIHAYSKKDVALRYFQNHSDAEVTLIGDSVHDYEVAKSLHANCILIADGHEHRSKLKQTSALVIDHLTSLYEILQ